MPGSWGVSPALPLLSPRMALSVLVRQAGLTPVLSLSRPTASLALSSPPGASPRLSPRLEDSRLSTKLSSGRHPKSQAVLLLPWAVGDIFVRLFTPLPVGLPRLVLGLAGACTGWSVLGLALRGLASLAGCFSSVVGCAVQSQHGTCIGLSCLPSSMYNQCCDVGQAQHQRWRV